jgi:N4-gp56 family major capsid protein
MTQTFASQAQRVGLIKGKILKHAIPKIYLGTVGVNDAFKKNEGKTVKYRRFLPHGASATQYNRFILDGTGDRTAAYVTPHQTSEGVTPAAEGITAQDVTATIEEYAILYGYTNQVEDLYEDDIPSEMVKLTGERKGLVNEMVLFGVLKAATNKFYGGSGTSRATVNGVISLNTLRLIARSLDLNHAETIDSMTRMGKSGNYGTLPVGDNCFPVWVSTDLKADLYELPNFTKVENYADQSLRVAGEVGNCEGFRFIASPELVGVQDSGAAVAGAVPALLSTTGTNADVYQVIIGSKDAWGHIGVNKDKMSVTEMKPGQKDKNDPLGQRGYVGCIWYYHAVVLNGLQMAVYEVAARALTD